MNDTPNEPACPADAPRVLARLLWLLPVAALGACGSSGGDDQDQTNPPAAASAVWDQSDWDDAEWS
ncbi:MAG: hypothetical protein AAFU73_22960 [Planctomycetota bacterium]